MNALQQDETCAEADTLPTVADAIIASITAKVRADGRRNSRRLTIEQQDKLRERIAILESRLRYTGIAMLAVALVSAVLTKAFL